MIGSSQTGKQKSNSQDHILLILECDRVMKEDNVILLFPLSNLRLLVKAKEKRN